MKPEYDQDDDRPQKSVDRGSKYNNFAICAAGIMAVLEKSPRQQLSTPRALLVMPLLMHDATVRFLGKSTTKPREIAALIASKPELFLNFNARFLSGLTPTLNAIQFLEAAKFVSLESNLVLRRSMIFSTAMGDRVSRILKATENVVALLASSEEELYLNLRIEL